MFEKDNTIYKTYGKNKLMAVKLWSIADGKDPNAPRTVKAKFEFCEFDASRQGGSKVTGQVDVYMDIEKFGYVCEYLKSGRIYGLFQSAQGKPVIQHFAGTNESKSIQISQGDRTPIMIAGQRGPGVKGNNGQTIPDYKSWNDQNSKKVFMGLSDEEAVKLGMCGLRAIGMLDAWTAFGTADIELARINPVQQRDEERHAQSAPAQQNAGYNQPAPAPQQAPPQNGYNNQGGYGYGQNGYGYNAGNYQQW